MVEDADKSFLNDIIKEEEEEDDDEEINLEQQTSAKPSKHADQLKRDKQLEKDVAEAVDEILEEAALETSKRPQPKKTKALDKSDSKDDPAVTKVTTAPVPPPTAVAVVPPAAPPPPPPPAVKPPSNDLPKCNETEMNVQIRFWSEFPHI